VVVADQGQEGDGSESGDRAGTGNGTEDREGTAGGEVMTAEEAAAAAAAAPKPPPWWEKGGDFYHTEGKIYEVTLNERGDPISLVDTDTNQILWDDGEGTAAQYDELMEDAVALPKELYWRQIMKRFDDPDNFA
jgi:hypothetical protein